jgi:DNA-binding NarL/FixJ family response regulator
MRQPFDDVKVLIYSKLNVVSIGLNYILRGLNCKLVVKSNDFGHTAALLRDTSNDFDVLIVDSADSNWQALQRISTTIRAAHRKVPRILVLIEGQKQVPVYFTIGVNRVIKKQASIRELVEAIKAVLQGKSQHEPMLDSRMANAGKYSWYSSVEFNSSAVFSKRESQVIDLLVQGFSQREVSKMLKVSDTAISTYKKRALDKVGMKSIGELLFSGWR